MTESRPNGIDYTMTWDCTFIIDGKSEEITFLTDDIEDVFEEYQRLKKKFKSVVWLEHKLHRKGKLILSPQMFPVDEPIPVSMSVPVR